MESFEKFESAQPNPTMNEVLDVEAQEVWEKRNQVAIIDVRRPEEYMGEGGHIAGSIMIVMDTLPDHIDKIPRDKTIVFVCRSGNRSGRSAAWALSEGFRSVYNLKGGMLRWNELKLETSR